MGYHDEIEAIKDLEEAIERMKNRRKRFKRMFQRIYEEKIFNQSLKLGGDSELDQGIRILRKFNKRIERLECKLFFVFGIG
jgi:hypothetical protein